VKVWIYRGEILPDMPLEEVSRPSRTQQQGPRDRRDRRGGGRGPRRDGDRERQPQADGAAQE
jgi:ribosomal protein S3